MSKRSWSKYVSAVGAGLIVAGLVTWSALANPQAEEGGSRQSDEQAAAEERRSIEAFLLDPHEQAVTTEARARSQSEHEDSDLDAQWATATWTLAQFIVGIAGLIGLVFTVLYARRTWTEAQATLHNQRAWITPDGVTVTRFNGVSGAPSGYMLSMDWKNTGASPARFVEISTGHDIKPTMADIELDGALPVGPKQQKVVGPQAVISGSARFFSDADIANIDAGNMCAALRGIVIYRDVFRPEIKRESEIWHQVDVGGTTSQNGASHPNFIFSGIPGRPDKAT